MNAAVVNQHILQSVDWSKYNLPDWLRQCGAWQQSCSKGYDTSNPLSGAMQKAKVRLNKKDRAKLIAYYLCDEELKKTKRHQMTCQISDDEARAVQRLVLDVINGTSSETLLDWMQIIISRYFNNRSWAELETPYRTVMDAKYDLRCGLAALHVRYPFIQYEKGTV
ncbi:hypothetical protein KTH40_10220 [Acinetobacter haemolyticus]|uniref:hypothetical protein n=1 Tax=Acinetobacter haemolyticus TaxID=29430 RepID=UPI0021CDF290|nr:hypothetical protein [Acinetobacter haemolyticus]MCU4387977.1 hypothetical protein [Acinetobacter haemolyticus]